MSETSSGWIRNNRVIAMIPADPGWEWQIKLPNDPAWINERIVMWLLCEVQWIPDEPEDADVMTEGDTEVLPGVIRGGQIVSTVEVLFDIKLGLGNAAARRIDERIVRA